MAISLLSVFASVAKQSIFPHPTNRVAASHGTGSLIMTSTKDQSAMDYAVLWQARADSLAMTSPLLTAMNIK